jgi:hypothetical protein
MEFRELDGVRGGGEIVHSLVSGVNLANARLDRLTLSDVIFEGDTEFAATGDAHPSG